MTKQKKTVLVLAGIAVVPLLVFELSTFIGPAVYGGEKPVTPEETKRMSGEDAFSFIKDTYDNVVAPAARDGLEFLKKSFSNPEEVFEDAFK